MPKMPRKPTFLRHHPHARVLIAGVVSLIAFSACDPETTGVQVEVGDVPLDSDTTVASGNRVLGVAISDRSDGDFNSAYGEAVAAGMESTGQCGSSEALQADFVTEAFQAWDRHADQVEMLEFVWMHDISSEQLSVYEQYYGVSDTCFLEYLATLGLKTADGADKPAWLRLMAEASARGW